MSESQTPQPPQSPDFKREFRLYPYQWITIPLLFIVPILAIFGLFDANIVDVRASGDNVELRVEYSTRYRYYMDVPAYVFVTNTSDAALPVITVRFDRAFVDNFIEIQFTPDTNAVTERWYEVDLEDVQAGETRMIRVDLQADDYGTQRGTVAVAVGETAVADVQLDSFIYP